MKLIIDIPEELYTYMQSESYDAHLDRRLDYRIRFAVRDGIPLPKGHGRLIDADVLIKDIPMYALGHRNRNDDVISIIGRFLTIIERDKESGDKYD